MATQNGSSAGVLRWQLDELPFGKIDRRRVADDLDLFYFLTGASFIEITSDLYTSSLVDYYRGDRAVTDWLENEWQAQELQHGVALRRYVEAVWPEFDWSRAYEAFYRAYAPLCKPELLGPTRGLEMAARCVVETGTATIYTMIRDLAEEPVLRQLADLIRTDEVSHYSYFFRHYKRYRADEGLGRVKVARALWGRISEIDDEDAWHAFHSVYHVVHHGGDVEAAYREYRQRVNERMRDYYPYGMAATMLLKPLALGPQLQRLAAPVLSAGAKRLFRSAGR